jgi:D-psicose/D-tagatose/L-ribulose 3-epimerase
MKFAAHIYMFTDHWADDQLAILDRAKALGVVALELSVGDDIIFDPKKTRARAESLGLSLTIGPGGSWPLSCDLSADDPAERKLGLAWHKKQVDLAAELGALAYAGALYGHPGVVKRRRPPSDEYAWTAEGLHLLADYAAKQAIKIVLEPMSHFRTHLVNTAEQMMRLLALADHENLYVLLDTYHLISEVRDYAVAIHTVKDKLWSFHACGSDRGVPGGDLVPWSAVFKALHDIQFDGLIYFESYNSSLGDFAFERAMFHNVCPDPETFIRQGMAFVKQGFASVALKSA